MAGDVSVPAMRTVLWSAVFGVIVAIVLCLRLWVSDLDVSAPSTTLHMGETVQLKVSRKTLLGTTPLEHPERTEYITNVSAIWLTFAGGVIIPDLVRPKVRVVSE
jgi:hypothetical protein